MKFDRRKDRRRNIKASGEEGFSIKNALYIGGTMVALGIIAFVITVVVYNNSLEKIYDDLGKSNIGDLALVSEDKEKSEETSTNLGKTINEIEKEVHQTSAENEETKGLAVDTKKEQENKKETNVKTTPTKTPTQKPTTIKKELVFANPVDGEIIKEYAKDKLVYSETLKEWVTHNGIDIKADKTTVVKAAEEGKVTAIKNDPRYGITVTIEHSDGFETRYANLLTAEFVIVGEQVKKGQTIGTVGNTSAFEIMDDYHLHFEILKNGENQDPTAYIK